MSNKGTLEEFKDYLKAGLNECHNSKLDKREVSKALAEITRVYNSK